MIKAILFDLDNTLLDIDTDGFMREYTERLARRFPDLPPGQFAPRLMAAVQAAMYNDDPRRTVLEAIVDHFLTAIHGDRGAVVEFDRFHRGEFRELKHWARPMPYGRELVEATLRRGLVAVVATAPLFPREAIEERLRWARVDHLPFTLVTSADVMHRSKPSPDYYLEIADRIGVAPSECLMIGDDRDMDGPASRAGMRVALVGPETGSPMRRLGLGEEGDESLWSLPRYPSLKDLHADLHQRGIV